MFFLSLYLSLNILHSNKYIASYAIVDIDKCEEARVNVQVQFLFLLSEITYFEAKEMFQCWIKVMIVHYTYLVMCVPDVSLLSPNFASRRIEESLWNLKQKCEGETFMAYA